MGINISISVAVGSDLDANYIVEGYYGLGWWFRCGTPD
jgi:hypothetical protein